MCLVKANKQFDEATLLDIQNRMERIQMELAGFPEYSSVNQMLELAALSLTSTWVTLKKGEEKTCT